MSFIAGFIAGIICPLIYSSVKGIKDLHEAVSATTEGNSFLNTAWIVYDTFLIYVDQSLKRNLERQKNGTYILKYVLGNKLYSIPVKPVNGPGASSLTPEERGLLSISHLKIHSLHSK